MARELFIIAGQSNALGGASIVDLSDQAYAALEYGVGIERRLGCDTFGSPCTLETIWGPLEAHAPLANPTGPKQNLGIELSLGRGLLRRRGRGSVFILHHGTNGTSLHTDWDPDATSGKRLFPRMIADANAQAAALGASFGGIAWIHGNSDAALLANAQAYGANLTHLIERAREELGANLPFVFDQLSPDNTVDPFRDELRAQQASVAVALQGAGVIMIPTEGLELRDAQQHYSANAFVTLGYRFAEAFDRISRRARQAPPSNFPVDFAE